MANTLIRNFRKPADKLKAKMTTDEMLAIQIANDANTADARKQIKLGIMPSLVPEQMKSLEEELLDQTKQTQNARKLLQEIGFRPDIVSEILNAMTTYEADPAIIVKFNTNAPAIKKDIMDRFNPNLISATFFMDYLVQYLRQLDATRGLLPANQGINRFNAVIDNPAELREVIISRGQIEEIIGRLGDEFRGNPLLNDVVENLRDLRRNLPDTRIINRLNDLLKSDRVQGVASLQEIANALSNLPTRDELEEILQRGSIGEILKALEGVSGEIIERLEEINSNLGVADVKEGYIPRDEGFSYGNAGAEPIPEAEVSMGSQEVSYETPEMITAVLRNGINPSLSVGLNLRGKIVFLKDDGSILTDKDGQRLVMTLKLRDMIRTHNRYGLIKDYGEEVADYFSDLSISPGTTAYRFVANGTTLKRMEEMIQEKQSLGKTPTKEGKGMRSDAYPLKGNRRNGRGLVVERPDVASGVRAETRPRYVEFGKYCIHLGQLEKDELLNVKYLKTNATIPKFPPTPVSEQFKDFLLDLVDKGNANPRFYSKVPPEERKLFQDISTGAGVFPQLNLPKTTLDTDAKEEKRFEILKGEWIAGNNSPLVIKELRKLIMKFMSVGKINRRTGKNLLLDIA